MVILKYTLLNYSKEVGIHHFSSLSPALGHHLETPLLGGVNFKMSEPWPAECMIIYVNYPI